MSIPFHVSVFKGEEQVYRTVISDGWLVLDRTDQERIDQAIEELAFEAEWLERTHRGKIPEWDMFWIEVGDRIIEYKKN